MPAERCADLHLHTHYSDGADPPARVVERAVAAGFAAIAITDHDTCAAVPEARAAARKAGIEVLTGTEISGSFGNHEVHVLAFGFRLDDPDLDAALRRIREGRESSARRMVEKLNALGIPITLEAIAAHAEAGATLGRMHIARELHAMGCVKSVQDAFNRYIGAGKRAYVPKPRLSCDKALDLVHRAGGLAFLAHPGIGTTHRLLPKLLARPFDGIEAYHSKHTPGQTDGYLQIARERGLLVSGGSDCHGEAKGEAEMGKVRLPWEWYNRLLERMARDTR